MISNSVVRIFLGYYEPAKVGTWLWEHLFINGKCLPGIYHQIFLSFFDKNNLYKLNNIL